MTGDRAAGDKLTLLLEKKLGDSRATGSIFDTAYGETIGDNRRHI